MKAIFGLQIASIVEINAILRFKSFIKIISFHSYEETSILENNFRICIAIWHHCIQCFLHNRFKRHVSRVETF
ncbi:MAG: hypothetical protein RIS64_3443 [Bacteroidota bacterium]